VSATTILCVGTTPAAQRTMVFRKLALDAVNRAALTVDGVAGKAINVAKALKLLGEHPVATGFVGGDRGEEVRALLAGRRIEAEFVTVQARTRQCITVVDEATGAHTELVEEGRPVQPADYQALLEVVGRRAPGCRAVVMSGTIASGGPPDLYLRCARLAQAAGALTVLDAQGAALTEALRAGPGLVKPNRAELAATAGRPLADEADLMRAMRELSERGAQRVVITAGKEPALAFDGKGFWRIVPPRIQAVSPIGSGDAFTAGLVWRLLRGDDLGEACRWGAAAGAANALTLMSGELERADVDRLVGQAEARRL
jgi:tagatose 6-phosphate kinase